MHWRPPFTIAFSSIAFSVFFLAFSHPVHGDTFLSSKIKELVWLNYSGRSNESFERVGSILSSEPDNYGAYFIRANCYGWFIARNSESRRYDRPLQESLEACIDLARRIDSDSPEYGRALYFKALAHVLNARFKAIRGYNFSARWSTRGAKDAAEELSRRYPDEIDAALPLAIFDATWGGSPIWQRMAQFALLLPRGQRQKGIQMLERISTEGDDSSLWASLVLLDIYEKGPGTLEQALQTAERLHNLFPDNSVIQIELGDCYRRMERWVLAEAVYRSIVAKVASRLSGYDETVFEISRLRTVECQVNLGKMDEAFDGVRGILLSNPINPEWVVPWAHFYAARIYRHRRQPRRAERALKYALEGKDFANLHEAAKRELEVVKKIMEEEGEL
jgi:tetratricopeptide (TPR) repeat protein